MATGLPKVLHLITDMKMDPSADVPFLVNLETQIIGQLTGAQGQGDASQGQPPGAAPPPGQPFASGLPSGPIPGLPPAPPGGQQTPPPMGGPQMGGGAMPMPGGPGSGPSTPDFSPGSPSPFTPGQSRGPAPALSHGSMEEMRRVLSRTLK